MLGKPQHKGQSVIVTRVSSSTCTCTSEPILNGCEKKMIFRGRRTDGGASRTAPL